MPGGLTTLSKIKLNIFLHLCVLQGFLSRHIKCQVVTHQPHLPGERLGKHPWLLPPVMPQVRLGSYPLKSIYFSPQETMSDAGSQSIVSVSASSLLPNFLLLHSPLFLHLHVQSISQSVSQQTWLNIDTMLGPRNIERKKIMPLRELRI